MTKSGVFLLKHLADRIITKNSLDTNFVVKVVFEA